MFTDNFNFKNSSDLDYERLKNVECESENERLSKELEDYKERISELGERLIELDENEKLMGSERNQWIHARLRELLEARHEQS